MSGVDIGCATCGHPADMHSGPGTMCRGVDGLLPCKCYAYRQAAR